MNTSDPTSLSLQELRELRSTLQHEDDVVSYVRRVTQARLDLVRAELSRRDRPVATGDLSGELRIVLSSQLTGGGSRPPRPIADVTDDALTDELETICSDHGFGHLEELNEEDIDRLDAALLTFERRISEDRRIRFERLDELSAELVRRYRDGEASVDGLLDG